MKVSKRGRTVTIKFNQSEKDQKAARVIIEALKENPPTKEESKDG